MPIKYYKKFSPNTKVVITDAGQHFQIEFTTLGLLGWYATDSEAVQKQLLEHMQMQRYGISEVSAEEFNTEYVEKKRTGQQMSSRPAWREELSKSAGHTLDRAGQLGSAAVARAVAVNGRSDIPLSRREPQITVADPAGAAPEAVAESAQKKEEFKPNLGKRKPLK